MNKLRCFVAMAFGYADTDAIFERFAAQYKSRFEIRRVDRINHNNDIDKQIIAELDAADFVLADHTYARPSAYFEAGYAQGRRIPVVYTSRSDHIESGQAALVAELMSAFPKDDAHFKAVKRIASDARKVHFDVKMRNIVAWDSPTDGKFAKALRDRIALVTAPLSRDYAEAEAKAERRKAFAQLSQHQQKATITETFARDLKAKGYLLERERPVVAGSEDANRRNLGRVKSGVRADSDTLHLLTLYVWPTFSKTDLERLKTFGFHVETAPRVNGAGKPPRHVIRTTIIATTRKPSAQAIRDVFPQATYKSPDTATLGVTREYLPPAKYWRKGAALSWGHWFKRGKQELLTSFEGTHGNWKNYDRKRIGDSIPVPVTQRLCIIGGIDDPQAIADRLTDL